jgi:hypothetical protein
MEEQLIKEVQECKTSIEYIKNEVIYIREKLDSQPPCLKVIQIEARLSVVKWVVSILVPSVTYLFFKVFY